jgi:CPA2 family monovalent cation:H+ antiporter-2
VAGTIDIGVYSDALVVLGTAGIVVPLVRRLGFSPVLGYLGVGALLGPLGLGALAKSFPALDWITISNGESIGGIAELGVVFLLFLIGLELSYERLKTMRRLVFGLGGLQVLITSTLLAGICALAGLQPVVAAIVGMSLALSSTAIVIEVLAAEQRLTTSAGRTTFAVLLAQDLAVIPILLFVGIVAAGADGSLIGSLVQALLKALIAVAAIVVLGRLLLRPLFRLVAGTRSTELFIAAILFVVVATGVGAGIAGLSMALGAFVAGLLLAETEYRKAIETNIEPFKGLLLGVFFFTVGMKLDIGEVLRSPLLVAACVVGLIAAKAAIAALLARQFRLAWAAALESGLLLGPGGEFAFVAVGMAMTLGSVPAPTATFVFAVTSLSMAAIPLLAVVGRWLAHDDRARLAAAELEAKPEAQSGHAIVVGHGRVGTVVAGMLERHGTPHLVVDGDPSTVAAQRRRGKKIYYGDATSQAFLETCGLAGATALIVTIHDREAVDEIVAIARRVRPEIPIVARARDAAHARHLYAMGVTDAVPETIEASLQLSEAALVGLGLPAGAVIASIHERRDEFRQDLQQAGGDAGRSTIRSFKPKQGAEAAS